MIVITALLTLLLLFLIFLKPWENFWLWIADIISQLLILIPVVIWLVWAIIDHGPCFDCGDREGRQCWVIVLLLWLGLMIGLLLFWLAFMTGYLKKKIPEEVREEHYFFRNKETVYEQVRNEEELEIIENKIR